MTFDQAKRHFQKAQLKGAGYREVTCGKCQGTGVGDLNSTNLSDKIFCSRCGGEGMEWAAPFTVPQALDELRNL